MLDKLPPSLANVTGEHCFLSCVGMSLAHYKKLGHLGLADIVEAVTLPGEEETPMARVFDWLIHSHGLKVEYIEKIDETNPGDADFIASIETAGAVYTNTSPAMNDVFAHVDAGEAVITQINYKNMEEDNPTHELDHAVYVGSCVAGELVSIIDPDGPHFVVENISDAWGPYPNLIVIRE